MKIIIMIFVILLFLYKYYSKIPSQIQDINRNKYNIFPLGKLTYIKDDKYIDKNNVIWIKRSFIKSLLHNPFKYYVFETYDTQQIPSSEVKILKKEFDNGIQHFKSASYNYYSSFNFPISHFFADVLPIIIYPKYEDT